MAFNDAHLFFPPVHSGAIFLFLPLNFPNHRRRNRDFGRSFRGIRRATIITTALTCRDSYMISSDEITPNRCLYTAFSKRFSVHHLVHSVCTVNQRYSYNWPAGNLLAIALLAVVSYYRRLSFAIFPLIAHFVLKQLTRR